MASVHDVAKYILSKTGSISAMKLQKLVYYSQAWSLVWDDPPDAPLFSESIRAWANGPVVFELYDLHRGRYLVSEWPEGNEATLTPAQRETIDAVVGFYGDKSPQWLSDLTHRESPWREAREGLDDGDRGDREITLAAMEEYYGSIESTSATP